MNFKSLPFFQKECLILNSLATVISNNRFTNIDLFMQSLSPLDLVSFYTQLRDPTGQGAKEITEILRNFLQNPMSISTLFEVHSSAEDPVIRTIATINIRDYLLIHKATISQQNIQAIRDQIIHCLEKETDSTTILQIIKVISILVNTYKSRWPKLDSFVFNPNYINHLSTILQIMVFLFPIFTNEEIQEKSEYFSALLLTGFQIDNFKINCNTLSFLFSILLRSDDFGQFVAFQEPLLNFFQKVLMSRNIQNLTEFLEPVLNSLWNNIIFLPLEHILDIVVPVLISDAEISFKAPLNSLLSLYLYVSNDQISIENLQQLFTLETNLVVQFYDLCYDDPTLTWLVDCDSMFEDIYMRIPEEAVVEMSTKCSQEIIQNRNDPATRIAAISIIYSAIKLIPENFAPIIQDIFGQIHTFLSDQNEYVQKCASDALAEISHYYCPFITANLPFLVTTVLQFMQATHGQQGIFLLYCIIKNAIECDAIFPSLYPIIMEWITTTPDPAITSYSTMILKSMISMKPKQMNSCAKEIAAASFTLLNNSLQNNFLLFNVLRALSFYYTDVMIECIDEFTPIVLAGIDHPDIGVREKAIKTIYPLVVVCNSKPDFQQILTTFLMKTLEISNLVYDPYDEQSLSLPGTAVKQACRLITLASDYSLLPQILSSVVHVAKLPSMNCLHLASRGFSIISELISRVPGNIEDVTNSTDQMIELLIDNLSNSSKFDFSLIDDMIMAIERITSYCVGILKHKELELIKILTSILIQTMNPYTDAILCQQDLLQPISNLFIELASTTEDNNKEILDAMLPILTSFFEHKCYQYQCFSIQTFAGLISSNSTLLLMTEEMRNQVIQIILNRIAEAIPQVASSAAQFICRICKNEKSISMLEPIVDQVLPILLNRLQSITNLTSENIVLRETLIAAVATIVLSIVEDKSTFPVNETMPIILKCLPIIKLIDFNIDVYCFINEMSDFICPELQIEYIRIYSWVLARPYEHFELMKIPRYLFDGIVKIVTRFLGQMETQEQEQLLGNLLNHDQYKLGAFIANTEMQQNEFC